MSKYDVTWQEFKEHVKRLRQQKEELCVFPEVVAVPYIFLSNYRVSPKAINLSTGNVKAWNFVIGEWEEINIKFLLRALA